MYGSSAPPCNALAVAVACAILAACTGSLPPPVAVADSAAIETAQPDSADAAAAPEDLQPDTPAVDVVEPPETTPDVAAEVAPDAEPVADATPDAAPDAAPEVTADATGDAAVDAPDAVSAVSCKPGAQKCEGAKLATCGSKGDGYIISNCFPGLTCINGGCKAVSNNLIVLFDTSGSMTAKVKKNGVDLCPTNNYSTWPVCEYDPAQWPMGCTRMGVSKHVFKQALAKIDETATRMALFRFPQKFVTSGFGTKNCSSGYYQSLTVIEKDVGAQSVPAPASGGWFWDGLNQVVSVGFPTNAAATIKKDIGKWMDGTEDGTGADPELRPNGGTPIGKSLFYIGEYLRHKVVIDGRPCSSDASCDNVNYVCKDGACTDPSRSCRDTVVVVFTDGGESDSNTFFSPRVQAKRLAMGLACASDDDCVSGATCQAFKACTKGVGQAGGGLCSSDGDCTGTLGSGPCKSLKQCMPKETVTGYSCTQTNQPCLPPTTDPSTGKQVPAPGDPAYCNPSSPNPFGSCVKDPRVTITAVASNPLDNVLRSPNGKPFGVKVHIVDIGSASVNELANSMALAISGGGKLLGADAGDPEAFLSALDAAFDFKNKKICGTTL